MRAGVGRPPGPPEVVRRNRLLLTVTDGEMRLLRRLAEADEIPAGTLAYQLFSAGLKRRGARR